jgi:HEAT repeat protein
MSRNQSRRAGKTAAELMAELERDPDYIALMQEKKRLHQEAVEEYARAAEPLLRDLTSAGFPVESLGDLRRSGKAYGGAVPVLLNWLPRISDRGLKEDVIRTLSVPWAKPNAAPYLIEEFKKLNAPEDSAVRWAIANALEVVADDDVYGDIVVLATEKKYGKAREMLVVALGNMRNPGAVAVLLELLDDDEVVGHAVMALANLKAREAHKRIEQLLTHPKAWVRRESKKALAKLKKKHS